jgi:hypothetical protein
MDYKYYENLFHRLYFAPVEENVSNIINNDSILGNPDNWRLYGDIESNFSIVENQQANPIAALVEKLTNSIDAMLMKKCLESNIDPISVSAPKNMYDAKCLFYKCESFDLDFYRNDVAQDIQILADPKSPKLNTSLIIYDNGEGQSPTDFPNTFLSLLRGNKNDIKFVQGQYNMGGAGAVVYCGDKRYQLIASKRYDGKSNFGFTLMRIHPLTKNESKNKKNTYYEYFWPEGSIPEFPIEELNLNLYQRNFKTGTVIKLYSYDLPSGSRSVISRDLNQSINEYLHNPVLPIYIIDHAERYPKDRGLERIMFGLTNRLLDQKDEYIDKTFSLKIEGNEEIGDIKVIVTVFKVRNENKTVKEFKNTIQNEFFKNNMSVVFSLNGQVHGFYTSEFITRSLKFNLLKDYLLIHVDCTNLSLQYRNNMFMASRDRLKNGKESEKIREILTTELKKSELHEIYKHRKDSFSVDNNDANDLIKKLSKGIPYNEELMKLLKQTLNIDKIANKKYEEKDIKSKIKNKPKGKEHFLSKRYPSFFHVQGKQDISGKIFKTIPIGGEKTIRFETDVENEYFDRAKEQGELKLYVLDHGPNILKGGNAPGLPNEIDEFFEIVKSSPQNGLIKVSLKPKNHIMVGDEFEIRADLSSLTQPEGKLESIFYVKIEDKKEEKKIEDSNPSPIGLPEMIRVYKDERGGVMTWSGIESSGIIFDENEIMAISTSEKEELEKIFINMDSSMLRSHKSKITNENGLKTADNKYISQIYFHTLFLFSVLKTKKIKFLFEDTEGKGNKDPDINESLRAIFSSYYGEFLLNFDLVEGLFDSID